MKIILKSNPAIRHFKVWQILAISSLVVCAFGKTASLAQSVQLIDGDDPRNARLATPSPRPNHTDAARSELEQPGTPIRPGTSVREGEKISVVVVSDVHLSNLSAGKTFDVRVRSSSLPFRNGLSGTRLPPGTILRARVLEAQKDAHGRILAVSFLFDRAVSVNGTSYPFLGAIAAGDDEAGLPEDFHRARSDDSERLSSRESLAVVGLWSSHMPSPLIVGGALLMRVFQGEINQRNELQRQIKLAVCDLDGDIRRGDRFSVISTRAFEYVAPNSNGRTGDRASSANRQRPSLLSPLLSPNP